MPPSGFLEEAINELLIFVQSNYEETLSQYKTMTYEKSESEFLTETVGFLEKKVQDSMDKTLLSKSQIAANGLTKFMTSCYKDLIKEIYAGKDKYDLPVREGYAMQKEINQIKQYLKEFKI